MKISAHAYEALGFQDGQIRLISYLITGLVSPFFLRSYAETGFFWDEYLLDGVVSVLHTVVYWEGNRRITIWSRDRYPSYRDVRKRLLWLFVVVTAFSLGASLLLRQLVIVGYGSLADLGWMNYHHAAGDISMGNSIGMGLIPSYLSVLLYESAYFFQRWKSSVIETERLQRVQAETQFESLKHQVNPHFLFNSLNTLTALIPQDTRQAVSFVQELAKVYRYVLDVNASQTISLAEELTFLRSYLFLLKARHGDRLQVEIRMGDEQSQARVIPLALQILIENAVKHNVVSEGRPLSIVIWVENGFLWVENPLQRKRRPPESSGLGLANIRRRYLLLIQRSIVVEETETHFRVGIPLIADGISLSS